MPRAAWCAECGRNVWLASDGRCQNGHGPESLGVPYDTPDPAAPPVTVESGASLYAPVVPSPVTAAPASVGTGVSSYALTLTPELTKHMGLRSGAFIIDYGLVTACNFAFGVVLAIIAGVLGTYTALPQLRPLAQVMGVAWLFAYFILAEGLWSTTPGKAMLGLRTISSRDGGRITWTQSVTRNLLLVVDLLFVGLVGLATANADEWRQRFGDRKAATVVVKAPRDQAIALDPSRPVDTRPTSQSSTPWLRWVVWGFVVLLAIIVLAGVSIALATM